MFVANESESQLIRILKVISSRERITQYLAYGLQSRANVVRCVRYGIRLNLR